MGVNAFEYSLKCFNSPFNWFKTLRLAVFFCTSNISKYDDKLEILSPMSIKDTSIVVMNLQRGCDSLFSLFLKMKKTIFLW